MSLDADLMPLFQPAGHGNNRTIKPPRPSWLVRDETGDALFVTQSDSFRDWWLDSHPEHVAEEVTNDVPAALDETTRT